MKFHFFEYDLGAFRWLQVSVEELDAVGYQIPPNDFTAWRDPPTSWVYLAGASSAQFMAMFRNFYCKKFPEIVPRIEPKTQTEAPPSLVAHAFLLEPVKNPTPPAPPPLPPVTRWVQGAT